MCYNSITTLKKNFNLLFYIKFFPPNSARQHSTLLVLLTLSYQESPGQLVPLTLLDQEPSGHLALLILQDLEPIGQLVLLNKPELVLPLALLTQPSFQPEHVLPLAIFITKDLEPKIHLEPLTQPELVLPLTLFIGHLVLSIHLVLEPSFHLALLVNNGTE
jgi:hypothetical protein